MPGGGEMQHGGTKSSRSTSLFKDHKDALHISGTGGNKVFESQSSMTWNRQRDIAILRLLVCIHADKDPSRENRIQQQEDF